MKTRIAHRAIARGNIIVVLPPPGVMRRRCQTGAGDRRVTRFHALGRRRRRLAASPCGGVSRARRNHPGQFAQASRRTGRLGKCLSYTWYHPRRRQGRVRRPREEPAMTTITQSVDLDRRGRVAVLTVNNPPVNALSQHVRQRSEEHTSELQSLAYLVCRLLLEKKKNLKRVIASITQKLTLSYIYH